MNPNLSPKLINKIESLCTQGCSQVNELLARAKNGEDIDELNDLSHTEVEHVIEELEQIMSVYDNCDLDNPADFKPDIK